MGFYMFQGRYSTGALKAMIEKPQNRRDAAKRLIEAAGGKLHHMFFAFGSDDIVVLIEAPDDKAAMAVSLAVGASGAMSSGHTTKLISMEDSVLAMTQAKSAAASYAPPAA
jgi:uncharacterized protein with GYD domain